MGMFDYVKYDGKCGKCGSSIKMWQSKDAECLLEYLEPKDVNHFYSNCDKCDTWNEMEVVKLVFEVKRSLPKIDYEKD